MQRHTERVKGRAVLHHPTNGFGFSERDAREHRHRLPRVNPLQNDDAGLEAAVAQAVPSDFEEVVANEEILWQRELGLVF